MSHVQPRKQPKKKKRPSSPKQNKPNNPPLPPSQNPSREQKRFRLSFPVIIIGCVMGILGGLGYSWIIAPRPVENIQPTQLGFAEKVPFVVAVILQYRLDNNLDETVRSLIELDIGQEPIQAVADIACDLARSGYVDSNSGLIAVQEMKYFYQSQNRQSCADTLIPETQDIEVVEFNIATPTPTLVPVPTKTPDAGSERDLIVDNVINNPDSTGRLFDGRLTGTYCDASSPGLLEISVRTYTGAGVPAQPVRVRWDGGSDIFYTGLIPERGEEYADFQMEAGESYTIDMPSLSEPVITVITPEQCQTREGLFTIKSYRISFAEIFE